ncbi:MAG TPA: FAD binding domain-containing protein [Thermoanaerobaculia bacterium]|nr:FAD binding domain-containing protein [Thermoanaerobaculia bacterium]
MLRLPAFDYIAPKSIEEAAAVLAGEGTAEAAQEGRENPVRLVAGGTDLWPNMKRRHQSAKTVVSLMEIPGLSAIQAEDPKGEIRIGATALLSDIESHPQIRARYPAFAEAVESISSPPLRNMGTIGGNLCLDTRCTYYNQTEDWRRGIDYCLKEKGKTCWVATSSPKCLAHTASDAAPMLQALGARVRLVSREGAGGGGNGTSERTIPIGELYRNDGIDYLTKRPEEILTEILLPGEADTEHCRSAFWKLRRRGSIDFAVLSAAVAVWTDRGGVVTKANIVLGAVASAPSAAEEAGAALVGRKLTEESIAEAAGLARRVATPFDNTDFQAQWRGGMVAGWVVETLRVGIDHQPK